METPKLHGTMEAKSRFTLRTLMPADLNPQACLFLKSVTVAMGFKPAFSAKVEGITSRASA